MATTRAIRDQVLNALTYLMDADLALFTNSIRLTPDTVTWHPFIRDRLDSTFLFGQSHRGPTPSQYTAWVEGGDYSAILLDGSLLQITYKVSGKEVVAHRLAFVPCPYDLDRELLMSGEPLDAVLAVYVDAEVFLRSPVRFDFDRDAARPGHPGSHLTINSIDCRIACVAPVHVMRFVDFVFRHFYQDLWHAHLPFFSSASAQHLNSEWNLDHDEKRHVHLSWDRYVKSSEMSAPAGASAV